MHGSAVGVQGLEAEILRRSEQPMRSTWAQVQGPEAETLQEFRYRFRARSAAQRRCGPALRDGEAQ
jgi:hypothetical protein